MPKNKAVGKLRKPEANTRVTVTMDGELFNKLNDAGRLAMRGLSGEIAFRLYESFTGTSPTAKLDLDMLGETMAMGFRLGVIRMARVRSLELSAAIDDRECIIAGMVSALQRIWASAPGDDRSNEALREAMVKRLPR